MAEVSISPSRWKSDFREMGYRYTPERRRRAVIPSSRVYTRCCAHTAAFDKTCYCRGGTVASSCLLSIVSYATFVALDDIAVEALCGDLHISEKLRTLLKFRIVVLGFNGQQWMQFM